VSTTARLKEETYLPDPAQDVAPVYDFLKAHEDARRGRPDPQYFLAGASCEDRVELPVEIYHVLRQVVAAMQQNLAVTVMPHATTVTTQQAAELLGVSRPTVIKLLENNQVPFTRTGSHRRILLRDLLEYRERRRSDQYAALGATAVDIKDEDDLDGTLAKLREARHVVANRRRSGATR